MAFTDDQIAQYALQLQQKGAPASDIDSFVQQAKQEQLTAPPQQLQNQAQQQQQQVQNPQIPQIGQQSSQSNSQASVGSAQASGFQLQGGTTGVGGVPGQQGNPQQQSPQSQQNQGQQQPTYGDGPGQLSPLIQEAAQQNQQQQQDQQNMNPATNPSAPQVDANGNPLPGSSPGSQFGGAGNLGKLAWQSIVQPAASFVAGAPVTGFKAAQGAASDIGLAMQPNLTDQQRAQAMSQNAQTAAAPVNLPGLGNVNMLASNDQNQFDPAQSMRNIIGKGIQTLSTEMAFGSPIGGMAEGLAGPELAAAKMAAAKAAVPWAAGVGALGAGGQTAQNPNAGAGEIAGSTLLGGVLGGTLQGILGKVFPSISSSAEMTEKEIEQAAGKIGLPKNVTAMLKTASPEDKLTQAALLLQGAQHVVNPDAIASPMESVASEVTSGMKKLFNVKQKVGQGIGDIEDKIINGGAAKPIDPTELGGIQNNFINSLKRLGAQINPGDPGIQSLPPDQQALAKIAMGNDEFEQAMGGPDFSGSKIKYLPEDQKLLTNAWREIQNPSNSGELLKAKGAISSLLDYGRANQQIGPSEKLVTDLLYGTDGQSGISGIIHNLHPDLSQLDDTYSELSDPIKDFQNKAGGKFNSTGNEPIDGTNTFNLLRQSLGAGKKDNQALLGVFEDLGQKYQVPELQNIMGKTRMAQTAEDIAGTDVATRPTGFAGRAAQGMKAAKVAGSALTGNIGEAIRGAQEMIPQKSPQETLMKLLQEAKNPSDLGLGKIASGLLKLLLPSGAGSTGANVGTNLLSPNTIQATSGLGGGILGAAPFNQNQ